ncbi:MAG: hypothetical protein WA899_02825 [Candidatus Sulfotelmatobacter sp.]
MEDRIRRLCSQLLAAEGDEESGPILIELREALHQHIERLRERFGAYPFLVERRARADISMWNRKEDKKPRRRKKPTLSQDLGT